MKNNDIIFFDFETTGKYSHTAQPIQLAAIVIDGYTSEVKPDSVFQTLIKPEFDLDRCEKYNLAPLTEESIAIHGKTEEMLKDAPSPKIAWQQFCEYVNCYNYKGTKWGRPIAAGQNIRKYDLPICRRLANEEPYKFGPWDEENQELELFQFRDNYDTLDDFARWFKFDKNIRSYSMDALRPIFGIDDENSHDALKDVLDGAFILSKFLKLYKRYSAKVAFKDSFSTTNAQIKEILDANAKVSV